MSPEVQHSEGEQQKDPVQEARRSFNAALFSEYKGVSVVASLVGLQNALLGSQLGPGRTYHELGVAADQVADRAEASNDSDTASTVREMKKGFDLAYRNFTPNTQVIETEPSQPTRTRDLSPMIRAKGGETRTSARKSRRQPQTAAPGSPEALQGDTLGSFLKQKRRDAGISQWQLGKDSGISSPRISGLENNRQAMNKEGLDRLASALSLSDEDKQKLTELYNKQFPQNPQQ